MAVRRGPQPGLDGQIGRNLLIGRIIAGVPKPAAEPGGQHQSRHHEACDPRAPQSGRIESDYLDEDPQRGENTERTKGRMNEQQNVS